ncbi:MAG: hypothetical protein JXA94_04910 [Parachlamydiales bacterium]|nr:hypothetical protein [Parachlamydiales bacterium]
MTSLVKWPQTPKREKTTFNQNPFNQTYCASSIADLKFGSCQETEIYRNASTKIHFYEDEIKDVVDKRIQLFFHQLIICWNVPFHFESISAQDQVGMGKSSTIKSVLPSFKHKTQGAHTSILPALLAHPICNPNESFVLTQSRDVLKLSK